MSESWGPPPCEEGRRAKETRSRLSGLSPPVYLASCPARPGVGAGRWGGPEAAPSLARSRCVLGWRRMPASGCWAHLAAEQWVLQTVGRLPLLGHLSPSPGWPWPEPTLQSGGLCQPEGMTVGPPSAPPAISRQPGRVKHDAPGACLRPRSRGHGLGGRVSGASSVTSWFTSPWPSEAHRLVQAGSIRAEGSARRSRVSGNFLKTSVSFQKRPGSSVRSPQSWCWGRGCLAPAPDLLVTVPWNLPCLAQGSKEPGQHPFGRERRLQLIPAAQPSVRLWAPSTGPQRAGQLAEAHALLARAGQVPAQPSAGALRPGPLVPPAPGLGQGCCFPKPRGVRASLDPRVHMDNHLWRVFVGANASLYAMTGAGDTAVRERHRSLPSRSVQPRGSGRHRGR